MGLRIIWAGDVDKLSALDQRRIEVLGNGWRSRFYGLSLWCFAIGVFVRVKATPKDAP